MDIETANEAQWLITERTGLFTKKHGTSDRNWFIVLPDGRGTLHSLSEVLNWVQEQAPDPAERR